MKNNNSKVNDIVENTRIKFEKRSISKDILSKLYSNYNPKVNINIFIEEAEKLFPKLNCGLASVYLKEILGGELVNGKYLGNNHTFLLLSGEVIDITADQYGGPRTYVGELKLPWSVI